jgi:hypothetical protein
LAEKISLMGELGRGSIPVMGFPKKNKRRDFKL